MQMRGDQVSESLTDQEGSSEIASVAWKLHKKWPSNLIKKVRRLKRKTRQQICEQTRADLIKESLKNVTAASI